MYILEYEYDGQQLTLNFISYEGLITEDDYKEIQNLMDAVRSRSAVRSSAVWSVKGDYFRRLRYVETIRV